MAGAKEPFVARSDLLPPKEYPEEEVTIDLGNGVTKKIRRGTGASRMSDEQWAAAQQSVRDSHSKDLERKKARSEMVKKNIIDDPNFDGTLDGTRVMSKDEVETLRKMPADDAVQFLEARASNASKRDAKGEPERKKQVETILKDGAASEATRRKAEYVQNPNFDEGIDPTVLANVRKMSPQDAADFYDRWKSGQSAKKTRETRQGQTLKYDVGGVPHEVVRGDMSDEDWNSIVSKYGKASQSANDAVDSAQLPGAPQMLRSGMPGGDAPVTLPPEGPSATPPAELPDAPAPQGQPFSDINQAPPAQPGAAEPSFMDQVKQGWDTLSSVAKEKLGGLTHPEMGVFAGLESAGAALKPDGSPATQTLPGQPPVPPPGAPVPPSQQGEGVSVSASARVPGSGAAQGPPVDPRLAKLDADKAYLTELSSKSLDLEAERAKNAAEAHKAYMDQVDRIQYDEAQRQNAFETTMQKHQQGVQNLLNKTLELSQQSIDPNRFYNSRDTGQQISGVIASALFGFTGQGMQWLQRVDSLVQQDIQAQAADLNRKRGVLSDASGIQNNLVAMAEQQGLRGKAAYDAAILAAKTNLEETLRQQALTTSDPELKLRKEQAAMAIRQDSDKTRAELQRQAYLDAQRARLEQSEINKNNAAAYATRMAVSAKESGDPKFSPGEISRMNEAKQGLTTVDELMKTLGPESTWPQAIRDEISKHGGQLTEAGRREKASEVLRRTIIRQIDASAIQKADAEYWKDKISSVGVGNISQADLKELKRWFTKQHNSIYQDRAAGFSPIPEQVQFTPSGVN